MADNLVTQSAAPATIPAGTAIAARVVTYSGDASQYIAPVGIALISGSDDAKVATDISDSAPLPTKPVSGATATLTNVVESMATKTVLAANTARRGWIIVNDSDAALNLKFGAGASATSYTLRVLPRGKASHADIGGDVYSGVIAGIWDSAPGTANHDSARVTEVTA